MPEIRVLIADDQKLLRQSLAHLLDSQPGFRVVAEAATGVEAVSLARELVPDVVLMDIRMPQLDGITATRSIVRDPHLSKVRVLVLTMFDLDEYVFGALRAGASGFLLKDATPEALINAVRTVSAGQALLAPSAIATLVAQRATSEGTRRARVEGAQALGLDPDLPTLLVTGGSLGAQHLNEVLSESLGSLPAGLQVLHLTGKDKDAPVRAALEAAVASGAAQDLSERYHVLDYLTTMEQAYACADGVLCRSGAGTVAEITALGLPALYVPLPIGNGEQRLNAADVLASGGGRMVLDADLKPSDILDFAMLISDPERQAAMARAAASTGVQDAAARLAALIRQCASIHDTPTDEENAA